MVVHFMKVNADVNSYAKNVIRLYSKKQNSSKCSCSLHSKYVKEVIHLKNSNTKRSNGKNFSNSSTSSNECGNAFLSCSESEI